MTSSVGLVLLLIGPGLIVKVQAGFETRPQNIAVLRGEQFSLNCSLKLSSTEASITWFTSGNRIIAKNDKPYPGWSVVFNRSAGMSKLLAPFSHKRDGRKYKCETEHRGKKRHGVAEVIVIDTPNLKCPQTRHTFTEGEKLNISCEVGYGGAWAPVLEWFNTNGIKLKVRNETSTDARSQRSRYRLVTKAHRRLHGSTLTCMGRFDQPKYQLPRHHATNSPTYDFKPCRLTNIAILWPPTEKRIRIFPKKTRYVKGTRLYCTADSYPLVKSIRWMDAQGNVVSNGGLLIVKGPPGDRHYICEASNIIDGQVKSARKSWRFTVDSNIVKCRTRQKIFMEGERFNLPCEMRYDGQRAPVLEWSTIIGGPLDVRNETDNNTSKYLLVTKAHRRFHEATMSCSAKLDHSHYDVPNQLANNQPLDDLHPCKISRMQIYWPPTEERIAIIPEQKRYVEGERIYCRGDTNPLPFSIRWFDSQGRNISDKAYFITGPPNRYQYVCEVGNIVGGTRIWARRSLKFTVDPLRRNGANQEDGLNLSLVIISLLGASYIQR